MDYADYEAGMKSTYFTQRTQGRLIQACVKHLPFSCRNKILVVGVGSGEELKELSLYGDVTVIDKDPRVKELLELPVVPDDKFKPQKCVKHYDRLIISDLLDYKPLTKFDLIVCLDVLEHVYNAGFFVLKLNRLLNSNGGLILSVPAHQCLFSGHDKALGHFRRYSKSSLRGVLKPFFNERLLSNRYFFLFPFLVLSKLFGKFGRPKVQAPSLPNWLNNFMADLLGFEYFLMENSFSLPLGVSFIYCGVKR